MSSKYEQLKKVENKREVFDKAKSAGYEMLQNGEIDAKTYYAKTRDIGIELGLIDSDEYPGRLPPFAEGFLEVLGGVGGAIGGAVLGAPAGPVGIAAGAATGAGLGAGSGSLAADFLGDLLAPDMPSPSAEERFMDAAVTGTIDAALTLAVPVIGKGLKPIAEGAVDVFQKGKQAVKLPQKDERISALESLAGITPQAKKQADILASEKIGLSLGQASESPILRGGYNLTSRMPIVGSKGQKQLQESFRQIDAALDKRISPVAKIKPLTEIERSELIKEFGLETFNNWRSAYKAIYKRSEKEMKKAGDFFNIEPLRLVARRTMPKSTFEKMPTDIKEILDQLNVTGFFVGTRRGIETPKILNFDDIKALDSRLSDLSKKYDPAKSQSPNNVAYRTVTALQKEMKNQLRNPTTSYGRLLRDADHQFKEFMSVVEGKTGKEFQKTMSRGALRPGVGKPPSARLEDLYKKTFSDAKSPEAVRELRNLIGTKRVNILAANYLDDIFTKNMRGDVKNFDALYKELGFDNLKGTKFSATKELLKDYKETTAEDLFKFLDALKGFPEAIPDVNTFIMRSGILRSAQGMTPLALTGAAGISAGGGLTAVAGFGLLKAINNFLARPFNANLIKQYDKIGENKKKEFIQRFLQSLPKLPDVPAGAIAVQPAVPLVSEQVQESMRQE